MFPGGKLPGEDFINSWYPIALALGLGLIVGLRHYFRGPKNPSLKSASGKVCIITGGTKGIGREIAREMAIRGARVIVGGRDAEAGKVTVDEARRASKRDNTVFIKLDLASFDSVREFAKQINETEDRVDFLFNNAGVMAQPYELTSDGNERHFQVNYLSHFLLTHLLLDKLKASAPARIINMLAPAYSLIEPPWFHDPNYTLTPDSYSTTHSYAGSKVSLYMFTRKLAKDLEESKVTVNCVLPGIVNTDIYNHMPFNANPLLRLTLGPLLWFVTKTSLDGAQTPLYVALADEENDVTGKIYKDMRVVAPAVKIPSADLDRDWWATTCAIIVGKFKPRPPPAETPADDVTAAATGHAEDVPVGTDQADDANNVDDGGDNDDGSNDVTDAAAGDDNDVRTKSD